MEWITAVNMLWRVYTNQINKEVFLIILAV